MTDKIAKTDDEWKAKLTSEQYEVARKGGTEQAFTGALYKESRQGSYDCICCGQPLFSSETKYESGTGWPSFYEPVSSEVVAERTDNSLFRRPRTEVVCSRCEAHLGHVFPDGPEPTGLRYCLNSAALTFKPEE